MGAEPTTAVKPAKKTPGKKATPANRRTGAERYAEYRRLCREYRAALRDLADDADDLATRVEAVAARVVRVGPDPDHEELYEEIVQLVGAIECFTTLYHARGEGNRP